MTDNGPQIAVLVKQVPDVNEITIDHVTRHARIGASRILNTFDHYALTAALGLKDQAGGSVTVITAGPSEARDVLLRCLASGADEAILIDLPDNNSIDTLSLAKILAAEVRKRGFDLVFAGQSTDDYEAGQVGPQAAELLGWPHVSLVTQVEMDGDRLRVRRDAEATREHVSVDLPAVLMVLSGRDSDQRYPTLRGMVQAKKKTIPVISPDVDTRTRLIWSEPAAEEREAAGIIVEGQPAPEAARKLVEWLKERKLA